MTDTRPENCRFRLQDEGKAYPRGGCKACGATVTTGLGVRCKHETPGPDWEGFGRDLLDEWPVMDIDGAELFEAALRNGLVVEIPGGYDPEHHIDAEGICPEAGDPWYEYSFPNTRTTPDMEAALLVADELHRLLKRYRTETPLGHQPHMIDEDADKALAAWNAATKGDQTND